MEIIISFVVILLHNGVSSEYVEVLANTFTSIINRRYTEGDVSVSSKIECTMVCLNTNYCEAIYYDRTVDESRCLLRKYTTNILYPLIIDTSLPSNTYVMFLRKHEEYCMVPSDYQFESNLMFWYKLIKTPKLNATDAREACRQDKAYLLLIDDDNQFDFTRNLLDYSNVGTAYIQGVRNSENVPFLDEMGNAITYANNWKADGLAEAGNYTRFNGVRSWIEASEGPRTRAYICQLRLN